MAALVAEYTGEDTRMSPGADPGTVGELLDKWLSVRGPFLAPKTVDGYRRSVTSKTLPRVGSARFVDITAPMLDDLYAELLVSGSQNGGPLSGASVRHVHVVLSSAFTLGVRRGGLAMNPAMSATPRERSTGRLRHRNPKRS